MEYQPDFRRMVMVWTQLYNTKPWTKTTGGDFIEGRLDEMTRNEYFPDAQKILKQIWYGQGT